MLLTLRMRGHELLLSIECRHPIQERCEELRTGKRQADEAGGAADIEDDMRLCDGLCDVVASIRFVSRWSTSWMKHRSSHNCTPEKGRAMRPAVLLTLRMCGRAGLMASKFSRMSGSAILMHRAVPK